MRERPILFSGPMIRAILAGTKTQTRRVCSARVLEAIQFLTGSSDGSEPTGLCQGSTPDNRLRIWSEDYPDEGSIAVDCPYGKPGDRLWARETWGFTSQVRADWSHTYSDHNKAFLRFAADGAQSDVPRWRPSIHMPRWASRISLEVTSVRVERLHDIGTADALAEGIPQTAGEAVALGLFPENGPGHEWDNRTSVENYAHLWDQINGKRAPWASNPWVWVVSFKRVEQRAEAP